MENTTKTTSDGRVADYGLSDHRELLDRARRTETKLSNLIMLLGVSVQVDGKAKCEVSVQSGVTTVTVEAADTPLSTIKAALAKAGFDRTNNGISVKLVVGGECFGYIEFK